MSALPPAVERWRERGAYHDFRGHRIFHVREGRGVPLVCVHGYPTSSYDFVEIWPALVARFDVIAPDMLGFGLSDKPRGHAYGILEQATLHTALLDALGVREAHLLVHDYGVTVGQELLARELEGLGPKLLSVTFLNGGLFPETHRPRPIQRLLASPLGGMIAGLGSRRQFDRALADVFHVKPTEETLDALHALAARDDGKRALASLIRYMHERRVHRARWVGALVETRVPMRFVNGVHDPISGAHMLERLLELRPDADIVRLPVGHYPQLESPRAVLDAFLPFVSRH